MAKEFKLQAVLKHRKLMEDRSRQQLAESLRQEQSAKNELDYHRNQFGNLSNQLENQQQEGIAVEDLWLYAARIENQRSKLKKLEAKIVGLEKKTANQRENLQATSRERQLLDNLREKCLEEQRLESDRKEALRMDELAQKTTREEQ